MVLVEGGNMREQKYNQTGSVSSCEFERKAVALPCQNCGKLVVVMTPFVGCVFCSDCVGGRSVAYMMKEGK